MRSKLNKFEHIHEGGSCTEGNWNWGWTLYRGSLYGEAQCIMGNSYMGPTVARQIDTTDKIATFLVLVIILFEYK